MNSIRLLLNSVIDYAGLFPPAELNMSDAVHNYVAYLKGEYAWALGRFIVQVARLDEFAACTADLPRARDRYLHLSVLTGDNPEADFEQITAFNGRQRNSESGTPAVIDAIEWNIRNAADIEAIMRISSGLFENYFEIPPAADVRDLVSTVVRNGGRAKVRTGGLTREMFPTPAQLAGFITLCVEAGVPFKATAGLHHPLRSIHPLTYKPAAPSGKMHGFLNVLLAAALARKGEDIKTVEAILQEEVIEAFSFKDDGIAWRDIWLSNPQLADLRQRAFVAFGACSFQEPVSDMQDLKLL